MTDLSMLDLPVVAALTDMTGTVVVIENGVLSQILSTNLAADSAFADLVATAVASRQPIDSDLTAIAALTTTTFGRALLTLADAAAGRSTLGLGTAATTATTAYDAAGAAAAAQAASQPLDSDLTAIAALTTTTFGRSLLALADAAAGRTALGLGTAATTAASAYDASGAAAAAQAASQPLDSDLTAIAALTTTTFGRSLLALADAAALRVIAGPSGTPSSTTYLRGDGTWATPSGGGGGASVLDDLTDVVITAAASGDILRHNGTNWVDVVGTTFYEVAGAAATAQAAAIAASQPLDSDLTAIAALTTTSFGRSLLTQADAAATRTTLGLGTAATTASTAYATAAQGTTADTAVQPARSISTTAPLTGGGDLSANRTLAVSAASATASGVVELATDAETTTGTDTTRATTPANVAAAITARTASTTVQGIVELATTAETTTGTDTTRAVTAAGVQAVRDLLMPKSASASITSSATPTPNADTETHYYITALAANATIGAPTGTPVAGQSLVIAIKDNGTARTLAFNAAFVAIGVILPTTTVISKWTYIGAKWNANVSKWHVLAVNQEA